ncbi:hypothetical protein ACH5RR_018539 [Cinchona calisaya]|uniref:Uncharacterized protein n=1 Tax=Cinchona calisaya TaxID=153742 RepID=A0ABD2ZPV5_9GENT
MPGGVFRERGRGRGDASTSKKRKVDEGPSEVVEHTSTQASQQGPVEGTEQMDETGSVHEEDFEESQHWGANYYNLVVKEANESDNIA